MEMVPLKCGELWYLRLILLNKLVRSYAEELNNCNSFQIPAISSEYNPVERLNLFNHMESIQPNTPEPQEIFTI
jgi:hypothetical protein